MDLTTPIPKLSYVGSSYQKKLGNLGIKTVGELLFHFPHRYEDFSKISPISSIRAKGKYTAIGEIIKIEAGKTPRQMMPFTKATLQDSTGEIDVVWFKQPYLAKSLEEGEKIFVSGDVSYFNNGWQFLSPSYEKIKGSKAFPTHTARIIPIYPSTEGVSSRFLRFLLKPILKNVDLLIYETLPEKVIKEKDLLPIAEALRQIHFPKSQKEIEKARKRLSFERIFLLQLLLLKKKMAMARETGIPVPINIEEVQDLIGNLSFSLTDAQKKASWQILQDMQKESPMNRLLEGDVGSGKTIVALIAALAAIKAGYQVAFMAPTEVLSHQHFDEAAKTLWRFKIDVGLLTGKKDKLRSKKLKGDTVEISRERLIKKCQEGELDLLVGTHALIQETVKFKNLALVILDEQHRFGTKQRSRLCLKDKRYIPHLLSMSATPIPRTLALTVYGELDLSVIDEMPKERKKIKTSIVPPREREKTYSFIKEEIKKGRQAFFICPRIEEAKDKNSGLAELKAVEEEKERLANSVFPELKVEMLHGKMKTSEKGDIMKRFQRKKIDILVSTSVIEVGVDIRNAGIMVIEGAERFGLAQLHQFRGRVGRGEFQSYCFLFPTSSSERTKQRLRALLSSENGFELAEKDLELRGPGDFLGKRQWGIPDFTMDVLKDHKQVEEAREAAKEILSEEPELKKYPLLKKRISNLEKKLHLE